MGNRITNIISTFVALLLIAVLVFFGYIFANEFGLFSSTVTKPASFQTEFVEGNTVEEEIKTPKIVNSSLSDGLESGDVENVSYDNVNINKNMYNQLDSNAQIIYRAFESNKEQMKNGDAKIEFGSTFSSLLAQTGGDEILADAFQSATEAYRYDNPGVFYLDPNKMYLNVRTTTTNRDVTYDVFIDSNDNGNYLIDEFSNAQEVNSAIAQIEAVKNNIISQKSGNTYKDIKMVHDYLIDNIEYDTTLAGPDIHDIYGALIRKKCVCEGYAKAMKYILDDMGIPCVIVIGQATNSVGDTENHAWNYVQIDGKWYAIDSTWDDPIARNGAVVTQSMKYSYFLKGSEEFNQSHIPSGQFSEGGKMFTYPQISEQNYKN